MMTERGERIYVLKASGPEVDSGVMYIKNSKEILKIGVSDIGDGGYSVNIDKLDGILRQQIVGRVSIHLDQLVSRVLSVKVATDKLTSGKE